MARAPALTITGAATLAGRPLFGPLELLIPAGRWTCLLGPSGIGKSTVLRLIAGLPTGVAFDGHVAASDGRPLDGRIAYMAQSDLLMPWLDVTGNVLLGHRLRGGTDRKTIARARELIGAVGLQGHEHKRPATLSGGMRQRAALARTLMEDRPVLLLDEPFSALDARTRAEMQELAAGLMVDRTVLLVTHDPSEAARLGHRIVVLTEHGASEVAAPPSDPIRAYDDRDSFECQKTLMDHLRAGA